ncbi:MAG: stage II sporulation protein M [Bacteroidales bacterium]|nr:stage II sporulation protein M [Bacteroidales bacterium]
MQELIFINKNMGRWKEFEKNSNHKTQMPPDELAAMFIQITDDLSYCRTFYPNTETEKYLNQLAGKMHYKIYQNRKESGNKIVHFWKIDLPLTLYQTRNYLYFSIVVFLFFVLVGAYSAANDPNFVRSILGDDYVDMTDANIEKGDPMAVYKQMNPTDMFLAITFNNISVAFRAFVFGLFFILGTLNVLMFNGIMLGSFQYYFFEKGVFLESIMTIWIHGTLEIFAITVAGAAGILLGISFLYPKTYKRLQSFKKGARNAVKIIIGIIPVFIVAGFLEGFITRYTGAPYFLRAAIILASLIFIVWYFFLYPKKLSRKLFDEENNKII